MRQYIDKHSKAVSHFPRRKSWAALNGIRTHVILHKCGNILCIAETNFVETSTCSVLSLFRITITVSKLMMVICWMGKGGG